MKTGKVIKKSLRVLLGAFLVTAGVGHLTFLRKDFQAQVPDWVSPYLLMIQLFIPVLQRSLWAPR